MTRDPGRERKVATLLFADLVGFTSLGEAHDAEVVSAVAGRSLERLAREVRRHGGTLEKFAGDALLVVFGVPTSHEDDPERAVRAALAMQALMRHASDSQPRAIDLALRIGIETGEVLVDRARLDEHRDLFVTGDAVNTASRLEAAADPGTILVGPRTYAATREAFGFEGPKPLRLKGKAEPVAAWRPIAATDGRSRRGRGSERAMVGRQRELARFADEIRTVQTSGRPRLVTLLGSAGVGKSRLLQELQAVLSAEPLGSRSRSGRCTAYGGASLSPLAAVLKADAGIADDDGPEVARRKLQARLSELRLGDARDATGDAVEAVLALSGSRALPREELFESWRRYFAAAAAEGPLLLAFEDIHWADDALLGFLEFLARWGEGPIAIVCLARPELLDRRPGWASVVSGSTTITLEPLDEAASTQLVESLLDGGVPASLRERIVGLAEGNPLFTGELVRMLVDQGVLRRSGSTWELAGAADAIAMPDSVHAVLAARLDLLSPEEKRLTQDAAVVGRIFWDRLVAHLDHEELEPTIDRLARLCEKEIVQPHGPTTVAFATEYSFGHVLIRDVAYDSLPKSDRAEMHLEVARWVEDTLPDRLDELAELIAGHLDASVRYREALGLDSAEDLRDLREMAYAASLRAARRAQSLDLVLRGCSWLRRAADLALELDRTPSEVAHLLELDIQAHGSLAQMPDHAAHVSAAIERLAEAPDRTDADGQVLAHLRSALAQALVGAEDVEAARRVLRQGIADLEPGPPTPGRARLRRTLGWTYWRMGPVEEAAPLLEAAAAEATACGDEETLRWAIHEIGVLVNLTGGPLDIAIAQVERSLELAEAAHDRILSARCHNNLPYLKFAHGDPLEPVVAMAGKELLRARRRAEGEADATLAYTLGLFLLEMGRLEEAWPLLDEAVTAARARGLDAKLFLAWRAIAARHRGDVAFAERDEGTLQELGPQVEPQKMPSAQVGVAVARWAGDPTAALAGLASAMEADEGYGADTVARLAARMALRLRGVGQLERAVALHQRWRRPGTAVREAVARSVDGLLADDAGLTVEKAAALLEDAGYIRTSLDAWCDAALLAARTGRPSVAEDRALAITHKTGMHPLLGQLPETRWIRVRPAS